MIIPTASSTWGDSTTTEGPLRKYVLAQLRGDADLDWVRRLRSTLVKDELKWRDLRDARPRLRGDSDLWAKVERGIGQATIVVIDPKLFQLSIVAQLVDQDAEPAALSPEVVNDLCATAFVHGTPISYLPFDLARTIPWGMYGPVASVESFTPERIRREIGGGLRQAQIFAARAHALFGLPSLDSSAASTFEVFHPPAASVILEELVETTRVFDTENAKTLAVLNRAANEIAQSLGREDTFLGNAENSRLVREVGSRAIDELQGADIAAAWAREMLETGPPEVLGGMFERVWLNGHRLK